MRSISALLIIVTCSLVQAQSILISSQSRSIMISGQDARPASPQIESVSRHGFSAGSPSRAPVPVFKDRSPEPAFTEVASPEPAAKPTVRPTVRPTVSVAPAKVQVRVYYIDSCGLCHQLYDELMANPIPGAEVVRIRGGQTSYPVVEVGDLTIRGYAYGQTRDSIAQKVAQLVGRPAEIKIPKTDPAPVYLSPPPQLIRDQWGTYNPDTYLGCGNRNCDMCMTRARMKRSRPQVFDVPYQSSVIPEIELSPGLKPTSEQMVQTILDHMPLTAHDVLADLGCGDARILIAAVRRYGCRAIGVEIDKSQALKATAAVEAAGLEDMITIAEGDARDFCPRESGVTAITAYLFPELLAELLPVFQEVRLVASPFHPIPGMPLLYEKDDVFIYHPRKSEIT